MVEINHISEATDDAEVVGIVTKVISSRKSSLLVLLQPVGSALSGVFAFAVLIIATRQGQFSGIASFGVGTGIAALASVTVGGGTTFAYTTGTLLRQNAVRIVRNIIVIPVIVLVTFVAVLVYSRAGTLDLIAIAAGGLSTAASVSAELDASFLRRNLRIGSLFSADISNRVFAFVLMLLGVPFAISMLIGSLTRAALLRALSRSDPSRVGNFRINKSVLVLAYEIKLTSLSILYTVCDRIGALTAPSLATLPVAGGFTAVIGAQQNASGVLLSGLQTTLAARSQQRMRLPWANRMDLLFVGAGLSAATIMILWEAPLVGFLGLASGSSPEEYWVALALLIPASVASRLLEFRFLSTDSNGKASLARAMGTLVILGTVTFAFLQSQIELLANGLVIAEVVSIFTSLVLLAWPLLKSRKGQNHA